MTATNLCTNEMTTETTFNTHDIIHDDFKSQVKSVAGVELINKLNSSCRHIS